MKLYALFVLALVAGVWSDAQAAPTKMLACNGCSPMQEEQKALSSQGRGFLFIYNVANNRVRKFEIIVSAGGGNAVSPVDKPSGATRIVATTEPPDGETIETVGAAVRELWEYEVDPAVREVFDAVVEIERQAPGLLRGKNEITIPIRNIGLTAGTIGPRAFDPREIAWSSATGGEYTRFINQVVSQLGSSTSAYRVSPMLGRALYGIFARLSSISISFSGSGFGIGLSIELVSQPVKLKLCDDDGNCVSVTVKLENGLVNVTFENVKDRHDKILPPRGPGFELDWGPTGREAANAYMRWLHMRQYARDILGGNQFGCSQYVLACTRISGTTMLSCQIFCN